MTNPNSSRHQPSRILRIATRNSPLAMWQAEHVAGVLAEKSIQTELVPLVSGGDVDMRPIDGTRQVGVFTKRIQQALVDDEADVAVHSLKDLPTETDERFTLAAVPMRETVYDCLVSTDCLSLEQLIEGAIIGTGSRRREAQLASLRPDLNIQPIRGNVQTRLAKLTSGEYHAIVLAEAGLVRLNMDDVPRVRLSLEQMLPAPGQGALGIETRSDDTEATASLALINDPESRAAVTAERTLLSNLHGGCLAPIAALAHIENQTLLLRSVVLSVDGRTRLSESDESPLPDDMDSWDTVAVELAGQVSDRLIDAGARDLITQSR